MPKSTNNNELVYLSLEDRHDLDLLKQRALLEKTFDFEDFKFNDTYKLHYFLIQSNNIDLQDIYLSTLISRTIYPKNKDLAGVAFAKKNMVELFSMACDICKRSHPEFIKNYQVEPEKFNSSDILGAQKILDKLEKKDEVIIGAISKGLTLEDMAYCVFYTKHYHLMCYSDFWLDKSLKNDSIKALKKADVSEIFNYPVFEKALDVFSVSELNIKPHFLKIAKKSDTAIAPFYKLLNKSLEQNSNLNHKYIEPFLSKANAHTSQLFYKTIDFCLSEKAIYSHFLDHQHSDCLMKLFKNNINHSDVIVSIFHLPIENKNNFYDVFIQSSSVSIFTEVVLQANEKTIPKKDFPDFLALLQYKIKTSKPSDFREQLKLKEMAFEKYHLNNLVQQTRRATIKTL